MAPRLIARPFASPARWGAPAPARESETDRDLARTPKIARGIRFDLDRCHSSRVKGASPWLLPPHRAAVPAEGRLAQLVRALP